MSVQDSLQHSSPETWPASGSVRRGKLAHVTVIDGSLRYLLLNQLCHYRDAGFEVYGVSAPGPHVGELERAGIRHIAIPAFTRRMSPWSDLRAVWQLIRAMRRERFTIVHTHTVKGGLLGQYAALLARVPIRFHTVHGLYFSSHMDGTWTKLYPLLDRIKLAPAHHVFSQNPEDVEFAVRAGLCDKDRIETIGNGIDITVFDRTHYTAQRRETIRAAVGVSPHHILVGTVGRFVAEKGYVDLCRAIQRVKRRVPAARFVFVGGADTEKKDHLSPKLLVDMGIEDVTQFLGFRTDIADLYAAMDLFVLPSHREGFPRALMEAGSMALPCIATNIRGCRQTVEHEVTGLLIPPHDPERLAAAIIDLTQNEKKRLRFGAAGREKAIREFDERMLFRRIERVYDQFLAPLRASPMAFETSLGSRRPADR